MAKERGWWKLDLGDMRSDDLSDCDREHIAQLIIEGFSSGEICEDEPEYYDVLEKDGNFGVFVYHTKTDECVEQLYFLDKDTAMEEGMLMNQHYDADEYYIEVWEKDEDGLWGNSGEPLYKSDKEVINVS